MQNSQSPPKVYLSPVIGLNLDRSLGCVLRGRMSELALTDRESASGDILL